MFEMLRYYGDYSIPVLNVSLYKLIVSVVVFFVFLILRKLITKIVFNITTRFTSKTKTNIDDNILEAFRKPLNFLIFVLVMYWILRYIDTSLMREITLSRLLRSSFILAIGWGLYNIEGAFLVINNFVGSKFNIQENSVLFPLLSRTLRIITVLLISATILGEFGFEINTFITGLGISGLAVALATQDSLANIFGGVTLLIDKPFRIGDWITFQSVEGVVEDISLRSIRIRTFEKALVTIPNSKLTNSSITNFSRRGIRRINFNLGVTYSTPNEKLEKVIHEIENLLKNDKNVCKDADIFVKFDSFGASSLNIFIYFFTNTSNWEKYLSIKHDINLKIFKICQDIGVDIAFPSTTVYLKNEN